MAIVASSMVSAAVPAFAQPRDQARAEAERLTELGAQAYARADYAGALDDFRRSYEVYPSPNTHSNLARALYKLGRVPEAMDEFEAFLAEGTEAGDAAREYALARKMELATQLGKLDVECDVSGAQVAIDGRPVGATPLPRAHYVAPGAHAIAVTAPGRVAFTAVAQLGPGELREVHASLPPDPNAIAPASEVSKPQPPRERTGRWMVDVKLGLAPVVYLQGSPNKPIYFAFTAELGFAVCCRNQLYVLFPFSVQYKDFGQGVATTILEFPLGLQYDIRLWNALFLPVQISFGYAVAFPAGVVDTNPRHMGVLRPSLGLKYVVLGRGNVGLDAATVPIFFGQETFVEYRLLFYGGVNF
jgi:hypothetical protein